MPHIVANMTDSYLPIQAMMEKNRQKEYTLEISMHFHNVKLFCIWKHYIKLVLILQIRKDPKYRPISLAL
jgi:hypothetical protein